MPNQICFMFPAFRMPTFNETEILVCLDSSLEVEVSKGLYWERGQLKYDALEDWDRFWPPIKEFLFKELLRSAARSSPF